MTVRPGKKFGFQSAAENLQRRLWPDRLRQTVPDRCSSRWKGAVANGRTHSVSYLWAGCFVGFVDMVSECRQLSLQFSALTLGLYSAHTHPDPHWSQTRRRLFFFQNSSEAKCKYVSLPCPVRPPRRKTGNGDLTGKFRAFKPPRCVKMVCDKVCDKAATNLSVSL